MSDMFMAGFVGAGFDDIVEAINNHGRVQYNWQDPDFHARLDKVRDEFYARHPEINREKKEFAILHPEKVTAINTLNRLSDRNAITPNEYTVLYTEIFNF